MNVLLIDAIDPLCEDQKWVSRHYHKHGVEDFQVVKRWALIGHHTEVVCDLYICYNHVREDLQQGIGGEKCQDENQTISSQEEDS